MCITNASCKHIIDEILPKDPKEGDLKWQFVKIMSISTDFPMLLPVNIAGSFIIGLILTHSNYDLTLSKLLQTTSCLNDYVL